MTATAKKKFHRDPNTLRCYNCGNDDPAKLKVSDDVVKRRRARRGEPQKQFDMAAVNCTVCGHQWYSMHKAAISKSHKLDVNAARRHKGQHKGQP